MDDEKLHAGYVRRLARRHSSRRTSRANAKLQLLEPRRTPRSSTSVNRATPTSSTSSCRGCGSRPRAARSRRRTSAACRTCWAKARRCSTRSGRRRRRARRSRACRSRPPDDYLREAMVATLAAQDVEFDYPRPGADRSAPDADRERRGAVARETVAARPGGDAAHPAAELRLAGADRVRASGSRYNPGTASPSTGPLGNQSRARRRMY